MSGPSKSWDHADIRELIQLAFREDIGTGDITSQTCIPADRMAHGRFFARENCVVAGLELLPLLYEERGGVDSLELLAKSGDSVPLGSSVAQVRGRARTLLECERTALNFIQRLSGVATLGRR